MRHNDLTGYVAIHPFAFIGATDPASDPDNEVSAGKAWIDTSTGFVLKVRNATDDGWDEIAGGGGTERNDVTALTSSSGAVTVDYADGDYFTFALTEDVTSWTFDNLPGSGKAATLMIQITQDASARTVAWPASFIWAGGSADSVSTGSGDVDVLAITTFDNGTTWHATLAKAFA